MNKYEKKILKIIGTSLIIESLVVLAFVSVMSFFENGKEFIEDGYIGVIIFLSISPILAIVFLTDLIITLKKNKEKREFYKKREIEEGKREEFEKIYKEIEVENMPLLVKINRILFFERCLIFFAVVCSVFIIYEFKGLYFCMLFVIFGKLENYIRIKFDRIYKNKVIVQFMDFLKNYYIYTPFKNEEKHEKFLKRLEKIKNIDKNEIQIYSEDYIETNINDVSVEMSEIYFHEKLYSILTRKSASSCGRGMFVYARYNKDIDGRVKIISKDIVNKTNSNFGLESVKMENTAFTEYFYVLTNYRILAMKLIKHPIMEYFVEFEEENSISIEMEIKNNELFLFLHTGNLFEGVTQKNGLNKEALYRDYRIIKLVEEIITKINSILEEM